MYHREVLKNYIFKYMVFFIKFTKSEHKFHRLSSEAFNNEFCLNSVKQKQIIQQRVTSFLQLLKSSYVQNAQKNRFGSINDGGYVLYSEINPDTEVISCGIGNNASFDFEIAKKVKTVYMYDHTIKGVEKLASNMFFLKLGINKENSKSYTTIKNIMFKNKIKKAILKLDIEGMEWDVLDTMDSKTLIKFEQIVVEFHNLFKIATPEVADTYFRVIKKLIKHFEIINIHPNNWGEFRIFCGVPFVNTLEITLLNKKNKMKKNPSNKELNSPNNPLEPEFILFPPY